MISNRYSNGRAGFNFGTLHAYSGYQLGVFKGKKNELKKKYF